MINNILEKVKRTPRSLEKKTRENSIDDVILTGTYGADSNLCEVVDNVCKAAQIKVKYVNETGPKLKKSVVKFKIYFPW